MEEVYILGRGKLNVKNEMLKNHVLFKVLLEMFLNLFF